MLLATLRANLHAEDENMEFPLTGQSIGHILIGERSGVNSRGYSEWHVVCACGNEFIASVELLRKMETGKRQAMCRQCSVANTASRGGSHINLVVRGITNL